MFSVQYQLACLYSQVNIALTDTRVFFYFLHVWMLLEVKVGQSEYVSIITLLCAATRVQTTVERLRQPTRTIHTRTNALSYRHAIRYEIKPSGLLFF